MRTIGFAGTAKNTGKTTAASTVLQAAQAAGLQVALTSIGYDGEVVDTVTGLPKPRYFLPAGALAATTDRCLATGSARCEILASTGIQTILGEIRLARVQEPGHVLLAGPNRRRDLEQVLAAVADYAIDLTLVDGALNRLVPLSIADGLVLSTGAALNPDPQKIADHAAALVMLFSLPVIGETGRAETIQWVDREGRQGKTSTGSLIGEESYSELDGRLPQSVQQIIIPGACDPVWLERLIESRSEGFFEACLVFGDPFHLVASGDPLRWRAVLSGLAVIGGSTAVLGTVPLRCLTVNPFFPRYDPHTGQYKPAYTDEKVLLEAVHTAVPGLPVVDVCRSDRLDFLNLLRVPSKETNG